jgi:hypothetical protein
MHCRPLLHYFVQGCQIFQNGLPDGKFSNQKAQFGLSMEDVGKFISHLVYCVAIWCILWPFDVFCGHFGIFFTFWYVVCTKKNLATLPERLKKHSVVKN